MLEYGRTSSCTTTKSNNEKTDRSQTQAMLVTGATCSTPVSALETATGLQSLEDRRRIKVLTRAAQFKRHRPPHAQPGKQAKIQKTQTTPCTAGEASQDSKDTDHPMHSRGSKPTFKRHRPPHAQPGEQANKRKAEEVQLYPS